MDNKIVVQALKDLREHIGRKGPAGETINQHDFARKYLSVSQPTLQRYENPRLELPMDKVIALHRVALEHGRPDLAQVFRDEAISRVPSEVQDWIIKSSKRLALHPIRGRAAK